MIKRGTKYINESEWFDEIKLSDLYDEQTGKFNRHPPIGTKVKIIFDADGEDEVYVGEVLKYWTEDTNIDKGKVFLFILNGSDWQSDFGWNCGSEDSHYEGRRCYWVSVDEEDVYLDDTYKPLLPVVDIKESEEEFDWVELPEVPKEKDFINLVKYALEGSNYGLNFINHTVEGFPVKLIELRNNVTNQKILQKAIGYFTPKEIKKEFDEVLKGDRGKYSLKSTLTPYIESYNLLKDLLPKDIKESEEEGERFKHNPPIGTRVVVLRQDYPYKAGLLSGTVISYYEEDPTLSGNVFLFLIDGTRHGWDCGSRFGRPNRNNKCYWVNVEKDEVYLEKPTTIVESDEDDLGWAQDVIGNTPSLDLDGKAWHINLNRDDGGESAEKIQKWLFSQGFKWSDGSTEVDRNSGRIISFQSVFKDDIMNNQFTYSDIGNRSVFDDTEGSRRMAKARGYRDMIVLNADDIISSVINESDGDDLEWAQDAVNKKVSRVKICDGKHFSIPTHNNYKDRWATFRGWNGWKDVIDIDSTLDRLCYVIYDHSYDRIYIPITEFNEDEIKFNTINESEEDDLEWAQDTINNPEYRYGDIVDDLDNDDIISLTGIITDSEGSPMVEVRDSEFRVYQVNRKKGPRKSVHIQWTQPSSERPSNWDDVGATVIMSPETLQWDKDLIVKFIHKENHPF